MGGEQDYEFDSVPPFDFGDEPAAQTARASGLLPKSAIEAIEAFENIGSELPPALRPKPLDSNERTEARSAWTERFGIEPPEEYFRLACATNGMALPGGTLFPVLDAQRAYPALQTTVYRENFDIYDRDPDDDPRDLDIAFARLADGTEFGFNLFRGIHFSRHPKTRAITEYDSLSEQLDILCRSLAAKKPAAGIFAGRFSRERDLEGAFGLASGTLRAESIDVLFATYRIDYDNPSCADQRAFVLFRQDGRLHYLQACMSHDSYTIRGFWRPEYIRSAKPQEIAKLFESGELYSITTQDHAAFGAYLEALLLAEETKGPKDNPERAAKPRAARPL